MECDFDECVKELTTRIETMLTRIYDQQTILAMALRAIAMRITAKMPDACTLPAIRVHTHSRTWETGFEEWETINGKRVSKLLHLKRALYGTKQASRLWQQTLSEFLTSPRFDKSLVIGDDQIGFRALVHTMRCNFRPSACSQ